jgi:hypothetical protein
MVQCDRKSFVFDLESRGARDLVNHPFPNELDSCLEAFDSRHKMTLAVTVKTLKTMIPDQHHPAIETQQPLQGIDIASADDRHHDPFLVRRKRSKNSSGKQNRLRVRRPRCDLRQRSVVVKTQQEPGAANESRQEVPR